MSKSANKKVNKTNNDKKVIELDVIAIYRRIS